MELPELLLLLGCMGLMLLVFWVVMLQINWAERRTPPRPARRREGPTASSAELHPLALEAMHDAHHDPQFLNVQVADLGVLAYTAPHDPPIPCREAAQLPAATRYVRPFAVVRRKAGSAGYTAQFVLRDGTGRAWFSDAVAVQINPGDTLVYAAHWLPLADARAFDAAWELRLSLNGALLAVHDFAWAEGGGPILRYLSDDGELSAALAERIAQEDLDPLSLDDLLGR